MLGWIFQNCVGRKWLGANTVIQACEHVTSTWTTTHKGGGLGLTCSIYIVHIHFFIAQSFCCYCCVLLWLPWLHLRLTTCEVGVQPDHGWWWRLSSCGINFFFIEEVEGEHRSTPGECTVCESGERPGELPTSPEHPSVLRFVLQPVQCEAVGACSE